MRTIPQLPWRRLLLAVTLLATTATAAWEYYARSAGYQPIHFAAHAELKAFDCPEWSHLSAEDSVTFTRLLVPHLQRVLLRPPAPGVIASAAAKTGPRGQ